MEHTVHVRVNDAGTGQPTPVRIRFTASDGRYLAPFGRLTDFATAANEDVGGNLLVGTRHFAYIDGTCEISFPAGPVVVEVTKGPEYKPLREEVRLGLGKMALRLTIERWINLRTERWYSGDTDVCFLSPHAALLEAAAEDLAVVNLLAERWERDNATPALTNLLAFSGQRPALEIPGHLVVVNTANSHAVLGRLALLNCHRVVYPLTFGGSAGADDWALADWCDQCHRKGGLVVWTGSERPAEALADLILGKVDALQIDRAGWGREHAEIWYDLLNCGFEVPLVGASGKNSNRTAVGEMRTYAQLLPDEEFNYKNWIEAIRAGRTFATRSPLLDLDVNGEKPGGVLVLDSPSKLMHVKAQACSMSPFDRLEIVVNGEVVATAPAAGDPAVASIETDVVLSQSGWLAARCSGKQDASLEAHTSPVYVEVAAAPFPVDPAAAGRLLASLDASLAWVHDHARCETDEQRQRLAAIFQAARAELLKRQGG